MWSARACVTARYMSVHAHVNAYVHVYVSACVCVCACVRTRGRASSYVYVFVEVEHIVKHVVMRAPPRVTLEHWAHTHNKSHTSKTNTDQVHQTNKQ